MIEFLSKSGLEKYHSLVEENFLDVSQTISFKDFEGIITGGNTVPSGTAKLFRITTNEEPWIIKFRLFTEKGVDSAQVMTATIGGCGKTISYCDRKNIIANTENLSAYSVVFAVSKNNGFFDIGLNIQNCYDVQHTIRVEIEYVKNCNVTFLEGQVDPNLGEYYIITEFPFREPGIFGGASELKGTLTIGDYSFNGSQDVTIPVYNGD